MQLLVLGMHRSGTSVLARLLNMMGVYFGPEGIGTTANPENPKGFWERRDVRILNDATLHAAGCDWDRAKDWDADHLPPPLASEFHKHANRLVLEIDAHRPWFIKEPRLCLLLPLWRKALEAPIVVFIYRHPLEVASSLHRRNGIPIPAGLALWEKYVRSASRASRGLPCITVSHHGFMQDPVRESEKLYRHLLGAEVRRISMPSSREISAFVTPSLYRHREAGTAASAEPGSGAIDLFHRLASGTSLDALEDADLTRASYQALSDYEDKQPPRPSRKMRTGGAFLQEELHKKLQSLNEEVSRIRELIPGGD